MDCKRRIVSIFSRRVERGNKKYFFTLFRRYLSSRPTELGQRLSKHAEPVLRCWSRKLYRDHLVPSWIEWRGSVGVAHSRRVPRQRSLQARVAGWITVRVAWGLDDSQRALGLSGHPLVVGWSLRAILHCVVFFSFFPSFFRWSTAKPQIHAGVTEWWIMQSQMRWSLISYSSVSWSTDGNCSLFDVTNILSLVSQPISILSTCHRGLSSKLSPYDWIIEVGWISLLEQSIGRTIVFVRETLKAMGQGYYKESAQKPKLQNQYGNHTSSITGTTSILSHYLLPPRQIQTYPSHDTRQLLPISRAIDSGRWWAQRNCAVGIRVRCVRHNGACLDR